MYRGFIKKINALDGMAIGSADLRILNMRIKRDILTKATSEFEVIGIPNAATVGDVFGVYDNSGKTVYLGVINSLENGVINTDQIIGIFDDNWKYNDVLTNSIEGKIKGIIERDFANSQDALQASIFSKFDINKTTDTINNFEYTSSRSLNFMNFLIDAYDTYWVLTDIDVKYNAVRPTITIGTPIYPTIKIGNNNTAFRNFEIIQEEQQNNKLIIYDSKGAVLRATYYATPDGITTSSSSATRPTKIRTVIVNSDDALENIVAANLSDKMYSHQINVDLVLNNKLYNFNEFNLGQEFDIFYNGEYYNSILTGYDVEVSGEGNAETVSLCFGKVRYTLENRIYEIANNSVDANSKVETIGGTIVSMETQIVQNSEQIALKASKSELDVLTGEVNANTTNINQNAESIALRVSQSIYNSDNKAINERLSSVEQKADSITVKFIEDIVKETDGMVKDSDLTDLKNDVSSNKDVVSKVETNIGFSSSGILIGKNNSKIQSQFTNDGMHITDKGNANTDIAWATSESFGATEVQIGSYSNAGNRWRLWVWGNGEHLSITRHS